MKKVLILIFGLTTISLFGQSISKDFDKLFNEANKKFKYGDFYGALHIYNQLFIQDSLNPELNYNMGVCNYELQNINQAEKHLLKASSRVSLELFRYKALVAHQKMKFKKAINYYNAYKLILGDKELTNEEINRLIQKTKYAERAHENKRDVLIQNVGAPVNTKLNEYVPLISASDDELYFTSRRPNSTGGKLDPNNRPFEDIYMSTKVNNVWSEPKQLREGINTGTNDACVGLSADGQILFLFRTNEDLMSGDLYECRMELDGWGDPVRLGSSINSDYIESSATITMDDKVIYFSSDRPGGFGGKDIYKVVRLPNGKWSKALNMGPLINTPYDEDAPFIHMDKKTLYFSSTGHDNMGGYDVFKTEYKDGAWSSPENLKAPINTVHDDIFFVLSATGRIGYYSSSREGGYGGQDIYKLILKDESIKQHVIKAVVNESSGAPLAAKITLIENETKKVRGIYNSNSNTGRFIMVVNAENTYSIIIEANGYNSYTEPLDFDIMSAERQEFQLEKKN